MAANSTEFDWVSGGDGDTDAPANGLDVKVRQRLLSGCKDPKEHETGAICTFVVFGASGDLAKKKTFPVLWKLFDYGLLSECSLIVGYARSDLSDESLVARIRPYFKIAPEKQDRFELFLSKIRYFRGTYDKADSFVALKNYLDEGEKRLNHSATKRIFYLALPPSVFQPVTMHIKQNVWSPRGINRVIVEKPFGRDLSSSDELAQHLAGLFQEEDIYRIDHYLGKEMVQNLMVVRFANRLLQPLWNRDNIACVQITFKEDFGCKGRGGYFDEFGIVRDILQNHLLQVLSIAAMEKPVSTSADDIRNEKVKVLKCIEPIKLEDCVFGQYTANPVEGKDDSTMGYLDDPTVPKDSTTATFCTCVVKIKNERWDGVPFIMRAGKALDERKAEIRIQFKEVPGNIFDDTLRRNELVVRIQPDEALWLNVVNKKPGMSFGTTETYLDLTYNERFDGAKLPDAYERLILDAIQGEQLHFVRSDELREAWRIFTPMLHRRDAGEGVLHQYKYGSRGPVQSDEMIERLGYVRSQTHATSPSPHM